MRQVLPDCELILLLGALVLSPVDRGARAGPHARATSCSGWDNTPVVIPVTYSLCASVGLALFYKIMKR